MRRKIDVSLWRRNWRVCCCLLFCLLLLQSCLGDSSDKNTSPHFQSVQAGGRSLGVNTASQATFKGKLYFTLDRTLYMLDGQRHLRSLTHGLDVRDPAVSPDGKWIAFVVRYRDYADLAYMPSSGGSLKIVLSGQGSYVANPPYPAPKSTAYWFAQPSWSADGKTLLFLSDLQKEDWYAETGQDAPLLDLQVFSVPFAEHATLDQVQTIAYADYGAGGDRDASYRPGHADQVVYTHYTYAKDNTQVITQIYLENAQAITDNPHLYHPGTSGSGYDPAVPLTPTNQQNLQPAFSPDGSLLAYVRRQSATAMGLYVMSVAEGVTEQPNNADVEKQALSPYAHSALLQQQTFVSQPTWSPAGDQLLYYGYNGTAFNIWLAGFGSDQKTHQYHLSTTPLQLTDAAGHLDADSHPCWVA